MNSNFYNYHPILLATYYFVLKMRLAISYYQPNTQSHQLHQLHTQCYLPNTTNRLPIICKQHHHTFLQCIIMFPQTTQVIKSMCQQMSQHAYVDRCIPLLKCPSEAPTVALTAVPTVGDTSTSTVNSLSSTCNAELNGTTQMQVYQKRTHNGNHDHNSFQQRHGR